ncbi:hypothetical protein NKJ35_30085 [Mesorhizobium sp. M0136]|uniref:hypothetical protein n=1 Tax=Mesorhizobium sp. M0136 TaxID=2956890 RepID=UPI003335128A
MLRKKLERRGFTPSQIDAEISRYAAISRILRSQKQYGSTPDSAACEGASIFVREAERSGGVGPQAPRLPSVGANAARAMAFRSAVAWIDQSLAHVAQAVERMPDDRFLAEHQARTMSRARRLSTWLPPCMSASGGAGWPEGRDE